MQFNNRFLTIAASAAGVTVLIQALAFLRQLLTAAYFGVGRDFDSYVMVFTMATVLVFTFANIFDSIAVPHLVRTHESKDLDTALALARSTFRLSLMLGAAMSLVFLIAVPLLAPIFATGFAPDERASLGKLAWYFLPWTLVCVPYYAAAARHKMQWRFNRVFVAEILIVVVSIAFLGMWHSDIRMLPLAYAAGYAVGLLQLVAGAALLRRSGATPPVRDLVRNVGELFVANQTGGLASLVERHIQSFLAAGGIGALNYSAQITSSFSSLLMFREIFMVPLTRQADRAERLERLLSGLLLLTVPISGLVACLAPEIVKILLQRGHFDAQATALTSGALRIMAFSLIASAVTTPLARMFQIVDRIHYMHVIYLTQATSAAVFGYLFVIILSLGVQGAALMQLAASILVAIVTAFLTGHCGIRMRWRAVLGWFTLAAAVSVGAGVVAFVAISPLQNDWQRLIVGSTAYGMVILLCYFFVRTELRGIALGVTPAPTPDRQI